MCCTLRFGHTQVRMPSRLHPCLAITALALAAAVPVRAAPATLTVAVNKPGHAISPLLYGIFFEDINCSADGGIYAEMVRNRSYEDDDIPEWWEAVGDGPVNESITFGGGGGGL